MSKRLILATLLALSTALVMTTYNTVRAEGDDVFVDEGDGDFDAVPPVADAAKDTKKETKKAKQAEAPPPPTAPSGSSVDEAFDDPAAPTIKDDVPAPAEQPAAPAEKPAKKTKVAKAAAKPKKEKHMAKPSKPSAKKSGKAGHGKFVRTKEACKAVREPASEETLFMTGASKKIWVEEVNSQWVRGFNKEGTPGYISRDCLE